MLSIALIVLSAINLITDYSFAMGYYGGQYVYGVVAVSVVSWLLIVGLGVKAMQKKSVRWNFTFQLFLFSWLAWYGIPYLGELP